MKTLAVKTTAIAAAAIMLPALFASPASAEESTTTSETEILITYDYELLEIGEDGDFESVDAYLEDTYGDSDVSTMDVGYGYLTNGTLKITSNCSAASVDYYKSRGSSIRAKFRVYWTDHSKASSWSPSMTISNGGGRAGWTFNNGPTSGFRIRGEMSVGGTIYSTENVSVC